MMTAKFLHGEIREKGGAYGGGAKIGGGLFTFYSYRWVEVQYKGLRCIKNLLHLLHFSQLTCCGDLVVKAGNISGCTSVKNHL